MPRIYIDERYPPGRRLSTGHRRFLHAIPMRNTEESRRHCSPEPWHPQTLSLGEILVRKRGGRSPLSFLTVNSTPGSKSFHKPSGTLLPRLGTEGSWARRPETRLSLSTYTSFWPARASHPMQTDSGGNRAGNITLGYFLDFGTLPFPVSFSGPSFSHTKQRAFLSFSTHPGGDGPMDCNLSVT